MSTTNIGPTVMRVSRLVASERPENPKKDWALVNETRSALIHNTMSENRSVVTKVPNRMLVRKFELILKAQKCKER